MTQSDIHNEPDNSDPNNSSISSSAGIKVMQRVTLPEDYVKENMKVEITAKVASGYNTDTFDSEVVMNDCMTLNHAWKQTKRILDLGIKGELDHFNLDMSKLPKVVDYVEKVIDEYYPKGVKSIPPHSRMRHIESVPRFTKIMESSWKCDKIEKMRRLIDLCFVSVLVDAGAGSSWKYHSEGRILTSSEGLGAASVDMFCDGLFSSDKAMPYRVNSLALQNLTQQKIDKAFQISDTNPLLGSKGRLDLLKKLGDALEEKSEYFGKEIPRPGNLLDYVMMKAKETVAKSKDSVTVYNPDKPRISLKDLWQAVAHGISPIWPKRASGLHTGDIWHYSKLNIPGKPGSDLVSFHKLTQWLLYSVIEVIEEGFGIQVASDSLQMTPLAEYRNGGLLVDLELLALKDPNDVEALHAPGSELIIEWRALTLQLIAKIAQELGKRRPGMTLAQVLEGGTWRAGRLIAKEKRSDGSPPIKIRSDGTVF